MAIQRTSMTGGSEGHCFYTFKIEWDTRRYGIIEFVLFQFFKATIRREYGRPLCADVSP